MYATEVRTFPADFETALGISGDARFQGFDINPWFRDSSSQIVVAIEVPGQVYEYAFAARDFPTRTVALLKGGDLVPFVDREALLFFARVSHVVPAFVKIPLPLSHDDRGAVYFRGDPEWESLWASAESACSSALENRRLCEVLDVQRRIDSHPLEW